MFNAAFARRPSNGRTARGRRAKASSFTTASFIPGVFGNEAGTSGGIKSGVFSGGGMCTPLPGTESQVVTAQKNLVLFHSSNMWMNGPAAFGPGNTIGLVVFQTAPPPDTSVSKSTNPKAKPETEEELKKKAKEEEGAKLKEAKSEAGAEGHDKRYARGNEVKPDQRNQPDIKPKVETSMKFEKKVFDESLFQTDDGSVKVGNLTGSRTWGVGYDHTTGAYKGGAGLEGGFTTFRTGTSGSTAGGLLTGKIEGEVLAAKGNLGVEGSISKTGASFEGKAGVEVIVAEITGQAAIKLTGKTIYDNTVGKAIGYFNRSLPRNVPNPLLGKETAPASWDKGVEIGQSATAGVGAAAEVSAGGNIGRNAETGKMEAKFTYGAKLGLGPKVGTKGFINILFGQ